ncbi:MAG: beta-ketoacyl synthase N-terminal-like domain-containing protein [Polyangiaceae bacterium]
MGDAVVVSAFECVTPAGRSADETWRALSAGRSGVRAFAGYRTEGAVSAGAPLPACAAEIPMAVDELAGSPVRLARSAEPGYHAARLVVARALRRLSMSGPRHDPERIAMIGAASFGEPAAWAPGVGGSGPDSRPQSARTPSSPPPSQHPQGALGLIATEHGLEGPCFMVGSACSSGAQAVYVAASLIRSGAIDAAVVVGHEFPLSPGNVASLDRMSVLYRPDDPRDRARSEPARASRPFSRDRRGFVLAEAAAALVLSSAPCADRRGWPRLAGLRGAFACGDADLVSHPSLEGVGRCVRGAMADAWLGPEGIGCVHAHATSSPSGDRAELGGLRHALGATFPAVPVVASKSQLGHALGASALLSIGLAIRGMAEGVVLPTLHHEPDPSLPAPRVSAASAAHPHKTAMVNAFGLGGANVTLIFSRGPDARPA